MHEGLWLDEFSTLWSVQGRFVDMLQRVPSVMGQSPFFFATAWTSVHVFGESEWALRLPSLLAGVGGAAAVGLCARVLLGRSAGLWSSALFWLCYSATWESVNARPYSLAMCAAGAALLGFTRIVTSAGTRGRALWVAGAAALIWTNYLFLPFVGAFLVAFLLRPGIRLRYPVRSLIVDITWLTAAVLPAVPQLVGLVLNSESQRWAFVPKHLGVFGLLAPFLLAMLMPSRASIDQPHWDDMKALLWILVGAQFATLEIATLFGLDVMVPRYASVVLVPSAVLAGCNMARLRGADRLAPLSVYVVITALVFTANEKVCGSLSGAGCQQWREGVGALSEQLLKAPDAPVLFRSGNAEDDLFPAGVPGWPATLAPLRSPGQLPPSWRIKLLTYRWAGPRRVRYFEDSLAPLLAHEPVFFMLCLVSDEPDTLGYCSDTRQWIEHQWPDRFRVESLGRFRQLSVLRFSQK